VAWRFRTNFPIFFHLLEFYCVGARDQLIRIFQFGASIQPSVGTEPCRTTGKSPEKGSNGCGGEVKGVDTTTNGGIRAWTLEGPERGEREKKKLCTCVCSQEKRGEQCRLLDGATGDGGDGKVGQGQEQAQTEACVGWAWQRRALKS